MLWEDFKAGFYGYDFNDFDYKHNASIELLSDADEFYRIATEMTKEWKYSCEHNLTDPSINKIAYIGQASCCYSNGSPSELVKRAWWCIPKEKRDIADDVARRVLKEWGAEKIMEGSLWAKDI